MIPWGSAANLPSAQSTASAAERPPIKLTWRQILGTMALLIGLACVVQLWMTRPPAPPPALPCHGNLRLLATGLMSYHDAYASLPPAFIASDDGTPMHSWRVLLLPFIGEEQLYKQYDFSEPWDGPHNRALLIQMPDAYRCPAADLRATTANYLAVVGDQTAWRGERAVTTSEIKDGPLRTILLVEAADSGIEWTEPRDLEFAVAIEGINQPGPEPRISSYHPHGANVVFCDGYTSFLDQRISRDLLVKYLSIADGQPSPLSR